jgi:putative inorganic carbon (hco3(-)) transporter
MRDYLIIAIVAAGSLAALRRPWIGVVVWTWLSIMNPHRYAWGPALNAPLAATIGGATLIGLLITRDRESPFKGPAVMAMVLFMTWMTLSWLFGLSTAGDEDQWIKVMKIDVMIVVGLALMRTKQHILALVWAAASLGLLGAKGGVFTLLTGGSYKVWGPFGSFIEDNNSFAVAVIMTIPLLRFLQLQLVNYWAKQCMTVIMVLCAASALGSQSRGALLAVSAMAFVLWWRGKSRVVGGALILAAAILLIGFMPESWTDRMHTIETYDHDSSAMGRISAWWTAWGIALHYPFGVGFNQVRYELFAQFSPYGPYPLAAHSIYFQVLGNHGFIGLALFLTIWLLTWRSAAWLRKEGAKIPEAAWCSELGAMCQVSLLGYLVGGAFLSLAYFDLPYNIMMLVVLTRVWVQSKGWEREPVYKPGWRTLPGLATVRRAS